MVELDDIEDARVRLQAVLRNTPVLHPDSLSKQAGRDIYLKCENQQRTGSYKIRGAYNLISRLPEGAEVVAASAGNHAQGVALAGQLTGHECTIFMPGSAPLPKVEATRNYGATIHLDGPTVDTALEAARAYAEERNAVFVHPFDHHDVIAGQGTLGIELLEQIPDAETIVVGVGGGGLVAGVATAVKAIKPSVQIIGVEAENAPKMRRSLDAGELITLDSCRTIADGIAVRRGGELPFEHIKKYVDDIVTVTEEEICAAVVSLLERAKVVSEPAGAVGLAAVMAGKIPGTGPVAPVVTGGNVDPLLLMSLIDFGMNASGRYLVLRVILDDRPGQLAELSQSCLNLGLNIIDVEHHRAGLILGVSEVEIRLTVETRNPEHRHQVVDLLAADGWRVELVG